MFVAIKTVIALLSLMILAVAAFSGRDLLSYIRKGFWTRRLTTTLTLAGITLVVFVFAAVLMLAHGVEETLVQTGSDENVIVLRRSATTELVSQIDRDAANIIKTQPEIAVGQDGKPLASTEVYVVINLHKKQSNDMANVSVRGISPAALQIRPQVTVTSGRVFQFGTREIMIGSNVAKQFQECEIGKQLYFGNDHWTIVGIFSAQGGAFESEIWGDVDQLSVAFGRPVFSSMTFRMTRPDQLDTVKAHLQKDPRTQYVELKREREYYREQSQLMADFISILGLIVTFIFSIGAMIGAMITMYAAVANRTIEIGTLRALGFRRRNILSAFLVESIVLSVVGGICGILLASLMVFVRISTVNFGTFSELAFGFTLSPSIIFWTMVFSIAMGIVGGFLPAVRASRLNIVNALRTS
ncbi:MAG TPA: ABC transporter permease [Bacteroidota bacterium]|nr:ABC transporter permease [Bacteroidota bacterium]